MKKTNIHSSLPALILTFALLIFWQAAAMGVNAVHPSIPNPDPAENLGTAGAAFYGPSSGNHVGRCHRAWHFCWFFGLGLAVLMDGQ